MSTTTTYGYKKPQTGDKGSSWFGDLEFDIDRLDSHDHEGTNSKLITPTAMSVTSQSILASAWSVVGDGTFKQTVTMPTGLTFVNVNFRIYIDGGTHDGSIIYPSIKKVAANTYDIYINDNTLDLIAVYK